MMDYTQSNADKVCDLIMDGLSLRKIEAEHLIPRRDVLRWLREVPEFQSQYAHAREEQADFYADEIIQIADDAIDPAKARVQVDSRKWIASKLKAKKYGDSTQIKHADADGGKLTLGNILGEINGRTTGLPGTEEEPR